MTAFTFDEFMFDDVRYELSRGGAALKVDAQVLELLAYLLRNPARVVTKEELIAEVWQGRTLGDNVISVCVAKLRKVLGGASNRCISNVYGRGYRFLRPVQTQQGISEPPRSTPLPPAPPPSVGGLLVGRGSVVGRMNAALDRMRAGRGSAFALLGEAGIGKTRLTEVLCDRAISQGIRVSWGRCHAFGDVPPLWPWLQIVRSCNEALPPELSGEPASDARRRDSELDDESVDTRNPSWLTDSSAWLKTLRWMNAFVSRVSSAQPWVIAFEDAQWADAASLQLLVHLMAELPQLPIMLILTVRDTELPKNGSGPRPLDYVLGHRECERVELARLRVADVDAYVSELFTEPPDRALGAAVFRKSEGNPYFMVELLRPWLDGPPPSPSELSLMGPALDIVRQPLRRLSPQALEVLGAASVIGRSFDLGLLALVTEREHESLIELLEDSMSSHVVVAARDNHTHFAFGHDLIRSALYEDLPSLLRVKLHQRVAEGLKARQASGGGGVAAEIAHHLLSALPHGSLAHAVDCARKAALMAVRVGAYADACVFQRRALDALRQDTDTDPALACQVLFELAQCERAAGEPGFSVHYREAATLARRHGFGHILAAVGQLMSSAPGTVGTEGAFKVLESALQSLPTHERALRAIVLAHLAWTPPHCKSASRVAELLDEAQELADGASEAARRTVLRARLYYAGGPDDHEQALAIAAEMERMVGTRGARQRARRALEVQLARIVALLQRGDMVQAKRAIDAFGSSAHELNHAELIWHYDRMCVVLGMNVGDFEFASAKLPELRERAERLGLHARRALEAIDWGELLRQTSDVTPFAAKLAQQLQPGSADSPSIHASKLRALVQLGSVDEARTSLLSIPVSSLHALPKSRDYLATLSHLAFTSVETKALGHAAALYELLEPYPKYCAASVSFHVYGIGSHFLAILARALDRRERALAHFDDALADHERLGLQPQLARTRYELAHYLSESSDLQDSKRARKLLEQVRASASQLKMEPLRLEADKLLATL